MALPRDRTALRDAQARVVRALEALRDADVQFTEQLLDDLAHDLWRILESEDKRQKVVAVAREHVTMEGLYRIAVEHDDGCPSLETRSLRDCTCDPAIKAPERVA